MANQRSASMTAISISLDRELLGMVDAARILSRRDRSAFIREALADKMRNMGLQVPEDLLFPPDLRLNALNETTERATDLPAPQKVSYLEKKRSKPKPKPKAP